MDQSEIIDFAREAIILIIQLSTPIMIVGLVVGVVVAIIQALTQVQEMTLAFVPKIIAIFAAIFIGLPFMASALIAFMEKIADKIVGIT